MEKNLLKRLRSRDLSSRVEAICELSRFAKEDPKALRALKKVAEGGRRGFFCKYGFFDQKYAFLKLVDLEDDDVDGYIKDFFKESVESMSFGVDKYGFPAYYWNEHIYPNATGELGRRLVYSTEIKGGEGYSFLREKDEVAHRAKNQILNRLAGL